MIPETLTGLSTMSAMSPETINTLHVCPVTPVYPTVSVKKSSFEPLVCPGSSNETDFEWSTSPVSVDAPDFEQSVCTNVAVELSAYLISVGNKSNFEPSICPMLINEPEYDLSSCRVSVTELSASDSVNAPDFELSASSTPSNAVDVERFVCPLIVNGPDHELSVSPVSVNETDYELSARLVVTSIVSPYRYQGRLFIVIVLPCLFGRIHTLSMSNIYVHTVPFYISLLILSQSSYNESTQTAFKI